MNYLDIIILAPLLWGLYKGFSRGLIGEIASLLALILGVWCAMHFSEMTANILVNRLDINISSSYITPVSFAVTFIVVAVGIITVSRLLDKLLAAVSLGGLNRFFGAVFGGLKTLLIVSVLAYFINTIDNKVNFISEETKSESLLYLPLIKLVDDVLPQIDFEELKSKVPEVDI